MELRLRLPLRRARYFLQWLRDFETMNGPGYATNYPEEADLVRNLRVQLERELKEG